MSIMKAFAATLVIAVVAGGITGSVFATDKGHDAAKPVITEGEINMVGKIAVNDLTKKHGLGYIDEAKMQKTIDLVGNVFKLKRPIEAEEVFVAGFIPGIK